METPKLRISGILELIVKGAEAKPRILGILKLIIKKAKAKPKILVEEDI